MIRDLKIQANPDIIGIPEKNGIPDELKQER